MILKYFKNKELKKIKFKYKFVINYKIKLYTFS